MLAETVWVLRTGYRKDRAEIARAIENLLGSRKFLLQDSGLVSAPLRAFGKTSVGFTDVLIAEINRANGCNTTATFDRKAARVEGFTLIR